MEERVLAVNDLSWQPVKNKEYILKNISEVFKEGGFYGILGPNGSGKTSLIRHILRFLDIEEGTISLE